MISKTVRSLVLRVTALDISEVILRKHPLRNQDKPGCQQSNIKPQMPGAGFRPLFGLRQEVEQQLALLPEPQKGPERFKKVLDLGVQVATGANKWK